MIRSEKNVESANKANAHARDEQSENNSGNDSSLGVERLVVQYNQSISF